MLVQGKARAIGPLVRDDVYRIAREAVRNAVQHARARTIEVELEYGNAMFRLRVRDDGVGVDPDVLWRMREPPEPRAGEAPWTVSVPARGSLLRTASFAIDVDRAN